MTPFRDSVLDSEAQRIYPWSAALLGAQKLEEGAKVRVGESRGERARCQWDARVLRGDAERDESGVFAARRRGRGGRRSADGAPSVPPAPGERTGPPRRLGRSEQGGRGRGGGQKERRGERKTEMSAKIRRQGWKQILWGAGTSEDVRKEQSQGEIGNW